MAINELNEIDVSTIEGRLLIAAIAELTCTIYASLTPNEILKKLNKLNKKMDWRFEKKEKSTSDL